MADRETWATRLGFIVAGSIALGILEHLSPIGVYFVPPI